MQQFDVFIFTETWLTDTIDSDELKVINVQKPFRCDRDTRSGGVAIYVKEQVVCVRRTDLQVKTPRMYLGSGQNSRPKYFNMRDV